MFWCQALCWCLTWLSHLPNELKGIPCGPLLLEHCLLICGFLPAGPKPRAWLMCQRHSAGKYPSTHALEKTVAIPSPVKHQDSLRLGLPVNRQNRILNERQTDFLVDNNKASDSQDSKYSYHHRSCGRAAFACSTTVKAHTHIFSSPPRHCIAARGHLTEARDQGRGLAPPRASLSTSTNTLFVPSRNNLQKGVGGSWGCSSLGRVLTFHAQSLGCDPQHSVNQTWWHVSGMPALGRQR